MSTDETPTHPPTAPAALSGQATLRNARLRISARSEQGRRANNEDRYLALRLTRSTTPIVTNLDAADLDFVPEQIRWGLAVADGMGGHAAGEVASTLALTMALQLSQQGSPWYVKTGEAEAKALHREVRGRIGVDVEVGAKLGEHVHEYTNYSVQLTMYSCKLPAEARPYPATVADLRWVTSREFLDYDFPPADEKTMSKLLGLVRN